MLGTTSRRFAVVIGLVVSLMAVAPMPESKAGPKSARSGFARFNGSKVHYLDVGRGSEALVFVHGWTCNANFWRLQTPAFSDKARVIAIDLPGHGLSERPAGPLTMDVFADAIDAVLKQARVNKAVLVGHSMGTPVIRQFYRRYPTKALALVIVDGALRPFAPKAAMQQFMAPLRGPNYRDAATRMIDGMLGPARPEVKAEIREAMLRTSQETAVAAMDAMIDDSIWGNDGISIPVLAVLAKSPSWKADTESFYRSLAPKLEFVMFEGVSHFLMMDEPGKFNETLLGFLKRNGLLKL